jgi:SAM-dependent methyltransferase
MLTKSMDFGPVAEFYDLYVQWADDLCFWKRAAGETGGPRLELMCGTGRITLALLAAGLAVEALDYSREILDVLKHKLAERQLSTLVHEADARTFDLGTRYAMIFIGFHSIAEVLEDADKLAVFRSVCRHLADGGVFWLSAHNPPRRRANLDGRIVELGRYPLVGTQEQVHITGTYMLDPRTSLVTGSQCYECSRDGKATRQVELPVRFHLVEPKRLEELLVQAGLRILDRRGNYDGAEFSSDSSPFFLVECTPV